VVNFTVLPPEINSLLSVGKNTVTAAETAAKSSVAMNALASGQLSLLEAAALTEFEEMPGAVKRLLDAAGTRRFEHTLAQLREERAFAEAEDQAAQGYRERGFTVVAERPESWNPECVPLSRVQTAEGRQADEQAVVNPAHWAVLLYESNALCDGEPES
jgi:ParB family chromosome partitioning protein